MYQVTSSSQRLYSWLAMTVTFPPVPYLSGLHETSITSAALAVLLNSPCSVKLGCETTVHVASDSVAGEETVPCAEAVPAISTKLLARATRPAPRLRLSMTFLQWSVCFVYPLLQRLPKQHSGRSPSSDEQNSCSDERNPPRACHSN